MSRRISGGIEIRTPFRRTNPSSDREDVLQAAVAGVGKVAAAIVALPPEDRERAFEAAEQAYAKTVRDLSYPEDEARSWVSAMMHRLRADVQKADEGGTDEVPGDAAP